ncbi:hypothetical protein GGI43DRAFT_390529, partial [Trichoderma evansii]
MLNRRRRRVLLVLLAVLLAQYQKKRKGKSWQSHNPWSRSCNDFDTDITRKPQANLEVVLLGQGSQSARALRPLSASAFQRHAVPTPCHVSMELGARHFFFPSAL